MRLVPSLTNSVQATEIGSSTSSREAARTTPERPHHSAAVTEGSSPRPTLRLTEEGPQAQGVGHRQLSSSGAGETVREDLGEAVPGRGNSQCEAEPASPL